MKIFKLVFLCMLLAVSFAQAKNMRVGLVTSEDRPANLRIVNVTDAVIDSANDTIAASGNHIYGPISLGKKGCNIAKYFQIQSVAGVVASGDSIQLAYQLSNGLSFADTTAWTITDTITSAGKLSAAVQVDNKAMSVLFIRILNIDGTRVELAKPIRVGIIDGCN